MGDRDECVPTGEGEGADGRICQDDFEQTIKEEPLLLEAFGPCLPKEKSLDNFMKNVLGRPDGIKSIKNFFLGLT